MEHHWTVLTPFWFSMEHRWTVLTPFWFSMEHRWTVLTPFWFSMEHHWTVLTPFWFSMEHRWTVLTPFWFSMEHRWTVLTPFWFSMEHRWTVLTPFWLSAYYLISQISFCILNQWLRFNPHCELRPMLLTLTKYECIINSVRYMQYFMYMYTSVVLDICFYFSPRHAVYRNLNVVV